MTDLRELFDRIEVETRPRGPEQLLERARHRADRLRRRRQIATSVTTVSLLVIVGLVAVTVTHHTSGTNRRVTAAQPSQPPLTLTDLSSVIKQPTALAVADGHVWVTGYSPAFGPAALLDFDAATGALLSQVTLPDDGPYAIGVIDSTVWVRSQQGEQSTHLLKIDAITHRIVATLTFTRSAGLAVTPTAVWAVDEGQLRRIDPSTAAVAATIPLPTNGGYSPLFVTAGPLGVWVTNPYDNSILRVDETTNVATVVAKLDQRAGPILQTDNSVWINTGTVLVGLNPNNTADRQTIDLHSRVIDFVADGHQLRVVTDVGVFTVNPATPSVTAETLPTGTNHVSFIAVGPQDHSVWLAANQPPSVQPLR